jgi:hypothetical protein
VAEQAPTPRNGSLGMIRSASEFVELRSSSDPNLYRRASHDIATDEVWLEIIERHPEMRKWVAHNKTVPLHILKALAHDADPDVRMTVAMARRTEPAVLDFLASDADASVRLAVAYNAKTPPDVLARLTEDPWHRVAEAARARTQNP